MMNLIVNIVYNTVHKHTHTAFNPSSADYIRQKYRKRVEQFKRQCKIINYLSAVMSRGYQDPAEQPLDYKHMMCTFMKLKDAALCV